MFWENISKQMYKLKDILFEIKLINKITPEMVFNLYELILKEYRTKDSDIRLEFYNILDKHNMPIEAMKNPLMFFKSRSSSVLVNFYQDLLKYKTKHSINEIKLINPNQITPELIEKLWMEKIGDVEGIEAAKTRVNLRKKYLSKSPSEPGGIFTIKNLYKLDKNQLISFYKDLLNLK